MRPKRRLRFEEALSLGVVASVVALLALLVCIYCFYIPDNFVKSHVQHYMQRRIQVVEIPDDSVSLIKGLVIAAAVLSLGVGGLTTWFALRIGRKTYVARGNPINSVALAKRLEQDTD